MKKRFILAIIFACCALTLLIVRYLPSHRTTYTAGDPTDHVVIASPMLLEYAFGSPVRRSYGPAHFTIPLIDGRGSQSVSMQLGLERKSLLVMQVQQQTLAVEADSLPRSYHLLAPPKSSRWLSLTLTPSPDTSVMISSVASAGRYGAPPLLDLLVLMAIASIPGLLMAVTERLPLDWAVLPSIMTLLYFSFLPHAELGVLMAFGPLVALGIGCAGIMSYARARPVVTLLLFVGAGLRLYALGWGSGYPFHPEEQALGSGQAYGLFARLVLVTSTIWSHITYTTPWSAVLMARLYSALLGILLIGVVYALGRQLLRPRWALLAAAFVTVAPVLVQQSHLGTGTQAITLSVALLMLCSTLLVGQVNVWILGFCFLVSGLLIAGSPPSFAWLTAPLVAVVMTRQQVRRRLLYLAPFVAVLLVGVLRWANEAVAAGATASNIQGYSNGPAYIYPLFNILLWGLGPLLMQIGVVGWGVAWVSSMFVEQRYVLDRRWFPLLWSTLIAFAINGRGPSYSLVTLMPFVPMLCLTGALLLQMFSQRLQFAFGRRTVRLLAGTAFVLALATSLGMLNMYRKPDQRLEASRWLVAHLDNDSLLLSDATVSASLPLGVASSYRTATLPASGNTDDALEQYALILSQTTHFVTTATRLNTGVSELRQLDQLRACTYVALFDGQLGFVERAAFTTQPHIGSWNIDNRRADSLIRGYDQTDVHIYERVVPLSPDAIKQALRCSYTM